LGNALRNMKDLILARFKAKYPGVNYSKKRLEALVAKLEGKNVKDEAEIDAQLDALNDAHPFDEIAKSDDQIRDLSGKLKKAATPEKDKDTPEPEVPADMPEWAKPLFAQNKTLNEKLAKMEGEKIQGTIKSKISESLKGKDGKESIPSVFWSKRQIPQKEEEIDAFVSELQTDYTAFKQELTNQGLSHLQAPRGGQSNSAPTGTVNADVKRFAEAQAKQQAQSIPVKTATVV
jgi:hypothetical protein